MRTWAIVIDVKYPPEMIRAMERKQREAYDAGLFGGLCLGLFLGVLLGWWLWGKGR